MSVMRLASYILEVLYTENIYGYISPFPIDPEQ